jgi:formylglycine-generating enzyme required for sulfatase activity
VTVGDAGNLADNTGYGAVAYEFNIGKYEVTIGQYCTFLNSVAAIASDAFIIGLWSPSMASDLNSAGISRNGNGTQDNPFIHSVIGPSGVAPVGAQNPANRPVTYVSWFDAARFCNWLHNGATNGASTETGAYALNGATNGVFLARPSALWRLPSEDEWYKAAFYQSGSANAGYFVYPTSSTNAPGNALGGLVNQANHLGPQTGSYYWSVTQTSEYSSFQNYLSEVGAFSNSPSAYGTFDQAGNVWEWNDAQIQAFNYTAGQMMTVRGLRGGGWSDTSDLLRSSGPRYRDGERGHSIGFRVVQQTNQPSPTTGYYLYLEKSSSLVEGWQRAPITADMLTPEGELDIGALTNTKQFYRLKTRVATD